MRDGNLFLHHTPNEMASQGDAPEKSREQVLAEREAAKEAKRRAKADKASKKGGADASGAAPKQATKTQAPSPSAGKSTQSNTAKAEDHPSVRNEPASNAAKAQQDALPAKKEPPRNPMLPPTLAHGVNVFSNVVAAKSAGDIRQQLVECSLGGIVHPSIMNVAQNIATHQLVGADARAIAVLHALRDVILEYHVPPGDTLRRDLITKLQPQIQVLQKARPLGVSVAHAIRYLNFEISNTNVDLDEDQAKAHIVSRIDHFVRDRITYATQAIASNLASDKIRDGDVVLTYAKSSVVEHTILEAHTRGTRFSVIVVDARPHHEGELRNEQ